MNGDMAPCTFAASLKPKSPVRRLTQVMKSGVTLQAELPALSADQEHPIRRAVRTMACYTAFHLCRRMLVNVRSPLFDMTLNASLGRRLNQA
jgi:hypothetical protein